MSDFSTTAVLSVELDEQSVRSARQSLADELSGDPVDVEASATGQLASDGGTAGAAAGGTSASGLLGSGGGGELIDLATERNELLEDIEGRVGGGGGAVNRLIPTGLAGIGATITASTLVASAATVTAGALIAGGAYIAAEEVISSPANINPSDLIVGGVSITAGSLIASKASIGPSALIASGAVITPAALIAGAATISAGVLIADKPKISAAALIGGVATITAGSLIGSPAAIGAGALVATAATITAADVIAEKVRKADLFGDQQTASERMDAITDGTSQGVGGVEPSEVSPTSTPLTGTASWWHNMNPTSVQEMTPDQNIPETPNIANPPPGYSSWEEYSNAVDEMRNSGEGSSSSSSNLAKENRGSNRTNVTVENNIETNLDIRNIRELQRFLRNPERFVDEAISPRGTR